MQSRGKDSFELDFIPVGRKKLMHGVARNQIGFPWLKEDFFALTIQTDCT